MAAVLRAAEGACCGLFGSLGTAQRTYSKAVANGYGVLGSLSALALGFFNLPLDAPRLEGQIARFRLIQKSIKTAAMLNGPKRIGADLETDGAAKSFAQQADITQIGQEAPARPVVCMRDIVAGPDGLAGQFANPGHGKAPVKVEKIPDNAEGAMIYGQRGRTSSGSGLSVPNVCTHFMCAVDKVL